MKTRYGKLLRLSTKSVRWKKQTEFGKKRLSKGGDNLIELKIRPSESFADMEKRIPKGKNYLAALRKKTIMSVADFEEARAKNIVVLYSSDKHTDTFRHVIYACACGSREFQLMMHGGEITASCAKCGNSDIVAWYKDGHVRNLLTQDWSEPDLMTLLSDRNWLAREIEKLAKRTELQKRIDNQAVAHRIAQHLLDSHDIMKEEFTDVRKSIEEFLPEVIE